MQLSNKPDKLVLPFAASGAKNTIPAASQIGIVAGKASLTDGFPPLTRTPLSAGGVPPSGLDMNGILYELSAVIRWANAGGGYPFDSAFATDTNVGGYPKGARIMRADGAGYWYNTTDNNVTDPESSGAAAAGWVPDFTTGVAAVTMTSANVTLTPAQYGKPTIVITGALTGNLNLIFPTIEGMWTVINSTTGAFSITAKTASGIGSVIAQGFVGQINGDGTNIYSRMADFSNSVDMTKGVALIGGAGRVVGTIAALKALPKTGSPQAFVTGYYAAGDGGGGAYWYDPADTTSSDNGGTIIVAADGGRWKLAYAGRISVKQFGAKGDGVTDDSTAIQNAINTLAKFIDFDSADIYAIASQLTGVSGQQLVGNGAKIKVISGGTIGSALYYVDTFNTKISDLFIDCNGKTFSGIRGYSTATGISGFWVDGCRISGTAVDATLQYGGVEIASTLGAGGPRNSDIKITNCNFGPTGTHGAIVAYSDGVRFTGNRIATATNHGMEAVSCTDVQISENVAFNCVISGFGVGTHCMNWQITNNVVNNCGGDGSITCEHNSVRGVISNNTIYNANTSGINISYGTLAAAPFNRVQDVICSNNVIVQKAGVTTGIGINFYSSTGGNLGKGVVISGNVIDGFNGGIAYAYASYGSIKGNVIRNLVGAASYAVKASLVDRVDIEGNKCESDSGDHTFQILSYAGSHSANCNVVNNITLASGSSAKSLVYIEGPNLFNACNNMTSGSLHYVKCNSTASVDVSGNVGNLAGAFYSGAGIHFELGSALTTTVGVAGTASALPALPLGYVTVTVLGNAVKIPYYNI